MALGSLKRQTEPRRVLQLFAGICKAHELVCVLVCDRNDGPVRASALPELVHPLAKPIRLDGVKFQGSSSSTLLAG